MTSSYPVCSAFCRKKYVKNCQIQHCYGDDDDLVKEEALQWTESAINDGCATSVILPDVVALAPEGAVVEVGGGGGCKWCGSTTHKNLIIGAL